MPDARRATAERNAAAIVDAAGRLLGGGSALTMAALAAEAGVSRVTLYAHFKALGDVVEAAVARSVAEAVAALEDADLEDGAPAAALERLVATAWEHLARQEALARAAAEYVPADRLRRAHAPLLALLQDLVARGQRSGAFRDDLPGDWLVTTLYALLHAAAEHARAHRVARAEVEAMLATTVRDVFVR